VEYRLEREDVKQRKTKHCQISVVLRLAKKKKDHGDEAIHFKFHF